METSTATSAVTMAMNKTLGCYVQRNTYGFEFIYGVIAAVIIAVGVLGNALSIAILIHAKLSCTTVTFLTNLAVYDTIYLVSQMFIYVFTWCEAPDAVIRGAYSVHFLNYPVSVISHCGTVYTVVALSVERYVAVARPFLALKVFTPNFARKVMALVLAVSVLYNVPRYLEHQALWQWTTDTRSWGLCTRRTPFQYDPTYTRVYLFYLKLVVDVLLPIIVTAVSNGLLLKAVRRRRSSDLRPHSGSSASSRADENRLSALVGALTVMLLLSQAMSCLFMLLTTTVWDANCLEACFHVHHLTILVQLLNSACNFLFFSLLGRSFRSVVLKAMPLERVTLFFARGSRDEKRSETEIALQELPRGSREFQQADACPRKDVSWERVDSDPLAPNVLSLEETLGDQDGAQRWSREEEEEEESDSATVVKEHRQVKTSPRISKVSLPQTQSKQRLSKETSASRPLFLNNGAVSWEEGTDFEKCLPEEKTASCLQKEYSLLEGERDAAFAALTRNFYALPEHEENVQDDNLPLPTLRAHSEAEQKASRPGTARDVETDAGETTVSETKTLVNGSCWGEAPLYGSF